MRTALLLSAALVASSAHAGTISIGGDFHLTQFPWLILDAGRGRRDFDKWHLEQLPPDERHVVTVDFETLAWIHVENPGPPRYKQWLVGSWPDETPNPFAGATTLELIGGPLVGMPDAPTGQEWTFIVDGGTPEVRTVELVPEPAAWLLAVLPAMMVRRRHA